MILGVLMKGDLRTGDNDQNRKPLYCSTDTTQEGRAYCSTPTALRNIMGMPSVRLVESDTERADEKAI